MTTASRRTGRPYGAPGTGPVTAALRPHDEYGTGPVTAASGLPGRTNTRTAGRS